MKNLFTLSYLFIFCNQMFFSQEKITNVDTFYLSPSWMYEDLKVKVFTNGDSIKYIKSDLINENNPFNSSTASAYTIKKINGEDVYFYNYNAVQDPRKLAPFGSVVPTASDYISLRKKGAKFITDKKYKSNKEYFVFSNVGYFQELYGEFSDNSQYYWIKSDKIGEETEAPKIHLIDDKFTMQIYSQQQDFGLPVRCIEDLTESIKTKKYDYSLLMPKEVRKLNKQLLSILPYPNYIKNNYAEINMSAYIDFDRNGVKKHELNSFVTRQFKYTNQKEIELKIQEIFKNKIIAPQYQNQYISSNYYFNHNVNFTKKEKLFSSNDVYYNSNYYSGNSFKRIANEFNTNSQEFIIDTLPLYRKNIYLQLVIEKQEKILEKDTMSRIVLTKVKTYGSPLWSFFPGLGTLTVVDGNGVSDISGYSVGLFYTSMPIGLIALGSFIYSSINYRKYLSSTDFSSSRYQKANNGHKLFLTTASIYTLLGIIDFSISTSIKIKSKKTARKINTVIQDKYKGAFELSNSIW